MAIHPPRVLAEEELFLLQTIIDKAKVVRADGTTNIVVPANQMLVDLLKALRLIDETGERQARLPQVAQSNPLEILRPSGQTTLAEACAKFLDRGPIWGQGTIEHYARVTRLLIDVLGGHVPIRGVTPDDLIRVKNVSMALPAQANVSFFSETMSGCIGRHSIETRRCCICSSFAGRMLQNQQLLMFVIRKNGGNRPFDLWHAHCSMTGRNFTPGHFMVVQKVILVVLLTLAAISPFMSTSSASKARPAELHRVF